MRVGMVGGWGVGGEASIVGMILLDIGLGWSFARSNTHWI